MTELRRRMIQAMTIRGSTFGAASFSFSSCASSRIGSAAWRTSRSARPGWSSSISATTFLPGMSRKSTTVKPSRPRSCRIDRISPREIVGRTVAPWSIPGNERSSTYRAAPVTLATPSLRGTFLPTAAVVQMAGYLTAGLATSAARGQRVREEQPLREEPSITV